jgi:serine beta-lactamase-like protein LACTB
MLIRRTWMSWLAILFLLLSHTPHRAQHQTNIPPNQLRKVEAIIEAVMRRDNIPGLSVAVVSNERLRWSKGYGLSDLENAVPAKAGTVYRLASVSKTITATAAMQLFERGKLDLDAPVQKYCPAFPHKQWPVTSRQLLGHLGGIRHYRQNGDDFEITRHYAGVSDSLDVFKADPLLHEPGTKYLYSSYGYNLLGCVIEGASGMKYADYVRENIFKPAGMDRIRVDDHFEIIPNRAQGYQKNARGELRNSGLLDTSYKIPAGGLASTVEDIARFAIALEKGILVKPETLVKMWTRQRTRDGEETSYGLGWRLSEENGRKAVWHSGRQQRVSTLLYIEPDRKLAVVLMSNLEDAVGGLSEMAHEIAKTLGEK